MLEVVALAVYLLALVPVAWVANRRMTEKSPRDFYLAGGRLGLFVLLFTLFATQYSGNTFMAFPGKAYRMGYGYLMSIPFMMAIVAFYLLYTPQLRRVAVARRYVTPCDWLHDRYGSLALTLVAAALMVWALLNFLLAQLIAMGRAFSGLTDGQLPVEAGILFLALVVVLYETVGGMRAVVWTDALQGMMMMVALVILGGWMILHGDMVTNLPDRIRAIDPTKVQPPSAADCRLWASSIFIVGLGGAMYPQAIQRIYAARSARVLRESLMLMAFVPLVIVLFALLMGLLAIPQFPELQGGASDEVMTKMLAFIGEQGPALHGVVVLMLLGAVAAVMSTADSVLLSLSSIVVQDLYGKTLGRRVAPERLLRLGKMTSWAFMLGTLTVALSTKSTLWRILEVKFELLMQVAPAFILGFYCRRLTAAKALVGIIVGTLVALAPLILNVGFLADVGLPAGLDFFKSSKWWGMHPGGIGCLVNFGICLVAASWGPADPRSAAADNN